jgi:HEAT repeat protein
MTARPGSTLGGLALLASLCALPAHTEASLSTQILYALTPMDRSPTREDLPSLEPATEALASLETYSTDGDRAYDFGLKMRAIRAIPHYCGDQPAQCRSAILAVFSDIGTTTTDEESPGQKILRTQAAIETLAAARTGDPGDVTILVGFLGDGSRDIRTAAARALRDLCNPAAIAALQARQLVEGIQQVKLAINDALDVLGRCGP